MNKVSLEVGGYIYSGWKSVEISAGIERQARDFTISLTMFKDTAQDFRRIKPGELCIVKIGNDKVLTGYVDSTPISYDAGQITRGVSGRSKTADLIDCSVNMKPNQWRNQTASSVITALASQYSIEVVDEASDGTIINDHTVEPGETVFESIDKILSSTGLLSTDDENGRLVIAKPGSAGRTHDVLEVGVNVLSGDASLDFSSVFSEYSVIGQKSGTDDSFGVDASEVSVQATDERVERKRKLEINLSGQTTPAIAQRRAAWEKEYRMTRALEATYKVQGWRQSNGELWKHNQIVRVVDPIIGFDRDMLISEITYSLSDSGTVCTMVVAPPNGFNPEPKEQEKKGGTGKKGRKGKSGDSFEYLIPEDWDKK